ncbi:ankyrin repeat and BTB/POZ domain-containing protein 1-like [Branchiostoma floridae]|uniref:Ankyrin repeat and BTB/POZ domain-containing protein 1 n=1 Tax=Branchiostoma floridae TaxID=7739 RepID=A0A9J7MQM5_BRAFL|nr:ankyrin repeat and BTB/POZ domain-containing protein 1-like [Branchiostoma floridae]
MDLHELFLACRKGDLSRVKHLVEQKEVDLNVRDRWDSTPLYYACLCGHEDLVEYLLDKGARCEANTFDGERCLYGALNDRIRNMLKNYKQVTSQTLRRDNYDEFLRKLLELGNYEDVEFEVHDEVFTAHKCILSARSGYFAEMLQTKWKNKAHVQIKHSLVNPSAFRSVLQYLYTGRLDTDVYNVEDCIRLAKQCRLGKLIDELEKRLKAVYDFVSTKPGTHVTMISVEHEGLYNQDLCEDFGRLAESCMPPELGNWVTSGVLPFFCSPEDEDKTAYDDVCFEVESHRFYCHKVFLCGRSDYFKALLIDHFSERPKEDSETEAPIPVVELHDVSAYVFSRVLYYIYQDSTEVSPDHVFEVLRVADMYLLPGLKRQCANVISQHLDENNVIPVLRASRLFELPRLEDQCTEYMAKVLDKLVETDDFADLVREDAAQVEAREETDSIPVVDDIRYHITSNVQTYSALDEANQKLAALDWLLDRLGLEG